MFKPHLIVLGAVLVVLAGCGTQAAPVPSSSPSSAVETSTADAEDLAALCSMLELAIVSTESDAVAWTNGFEIDGDLDVVKDMVEAHCPEQEG